MSASVTCRRIVCSALFALSLAACGGSSDAAPPDATKPKTCVPGTGYECWPLGGCHGHQMCMADGSGLTACECDTPSGAAGSGSDDGGALTDAGDTAGKGGSDAGTATRDAGTGVEICDNGKDDDGNGKIDCADDACGSHQCVAAAPSGFAGPVDLFLGTGNLPKCGNGFDQTVLSGGTAAVADPATCSSCQCSAAAACASFLDFRTSAASSCGTGTTCTSSLNASCASLSNSCLSGQSTVSLEARPVPSDSCTVSKATATKTKAGWAVQALACQPAHLGEGCKQHQVCAPHALSAPFSSKLCVYKTGDVSCPSSTYTDKRVYYTKLIDSRACSACACSDTGTCSYSWQVYSDSDPSCQSAPTVTLSAGQCAQVNPVSDKLRVGAVISGSPACSSSGGQPQGSVDASNAVTVCCEP